jgi:hypothetical protein
VIEKRDESVFVACPPPCTNGERCREEVLCTPETCPHGQKGWRHTAECIKHICAHDFESGPGVEYADGLSTTSCACGMTAFSHDMRYAP